MDCEKNVEERKSISRIKVGMWDTLRISHLAVEQPIKDLYLSNKGSLEDILLNRNQKRMKKTASCRFVNK